MNINNPDIHKIAKKFDKTVFKMANELNFTLLKELYSEIEKQNEIKNLNFKSELFNRLTKRLECYVTSDIPTDVFADIIRIIREEILKK